MSALADLHFLRPLALLLLLALPLLALALRGARRDARAWRQVVDPHLLPHLLERGDSRHGRGALVLLLCGWALGCIALAGPAWEREPVPLHRNQDARVIVLSLSPTLLAQDEKPSRLARARFRVHDILARSRDRQTALVAYGGDAFVVAPLTDDVATVGNLVDSLDPSMMPVAGDAASLGIERAVALATQAGVRGGEIVLIADDVDARAAAAARHAREQGLSVSVLGVGSTAGAPVPLAQGDFMKDARGNVVLARLDEAALRRVADAGGGRYARVSDGTRDLDVVLGDPVSLATATADDPAAAATLRWRDRGAWFALLLLPLVLAGFRRGWLMSFVLLAVAPAPSAQAASFADLWQRRDQQVADALRAGDVQRAAQLAPSAEWRAAAAYRGGDYGAAAQAYAQVEGADADYNRGNALARQGRLEEALAAYDDALREQPDMPDAIANRAAVEAALRQQQEQQQQQQQQQQQGNDRQGEPDAQAGDRPQGDETPADGGEDAGSQAPDDASDPQGASSGQDPQSPDAAQEPGESSSDDGDGEAAADGASPQDAQDGPPSEDQQRAYSQAMDEAVRGNAEAPAPDGADGEGEQAVPLSAEEEVAREREQAQEQWLQRVPDDPGGLLRRKFQLEYQRRQREGGGP